MRWIVDGNNVYGSRPDGWWNDRQRAAARLAQRIATWARTTTDDVVLVFDAPIGDDVTMLAGGNLTIEASRRKGRNAADDLIVELADTHDHQTGQLTVVTSDKGLRQRLDDSVRVVGVGAFRDLIGY